MKKLLCPSMMCANYGNLYHEIKELEAAGIDIFHIDVMDGNYVPNFGMGLQDMEYICRNTIVPVDVHLMIMNPGEYVEKFAKIGAKIIYIHPESDLHPMRTLQKIKDRGCKAGIAFNPGTSVAMIEPLFSLIDYVMVMSVNPGFAGQTYIESVDEKIEMLLEYQKKHRFEIMLDGACSPERIQVLSKKGVNGFVLGTSALFGKSRSYAQIIAELRAL